ATFGAFAETASCAIEVPAHSHWSYATSVSFAVLYAFVARFVAGRIWEACPPGQGWIAGAALVLLASAVVGFLGVVTGEFWALTIEGIRIGGGHMSYRANRVPWAHRLSADQSVRGGV